MKRFTKLAGIIACVAIIGFSFTSCDNILTDFGVMGFEGKWTNLDMLSLGGYTDASFMFTGDNFICTFTTPTGIEDRTYSGTFTFTDTTITFVYGPSLSRIVTQPYSFSETGTAFSLYHPQDGNNYFALNTFVKQ